MELLDDEPARGTLSYTTFSAGLALFLYAGFYLVCDRWGWRLRLFETLGTNALAGHLIWSMDPFQPLHRMTRPAGTSPSSLRSTLASHGSCCGLSNGTRSSFDFDPSDEPLHWQYLILPQKSTPPNVSKLNAAGCSGSLLWDGQCSIRCWSICRSGQAGGNVADDEADGGSIGYLMYLPKDYDEQGNQCL